MPCALVVTGHDIQMKGLVYLVHISFTVYTALIYTHLQESKAQVRHLLSETKIAASDQRKVKISRGVTALSARYLQSEASCASGLDNHIDVTAEYVPLVQDSIIALSRRKAEGTPETRPTMCTTGLMVAYNSMLWSLDRAVSVMVHLKFLA